MNITLTEKQCKPVKQIKGLTTKKALLSNKVLNKSAIWCHEVT